MTVAKPVKQTLIDTISFGYTVLNRRLWVVAIPIILDIYLWVGKQLSLAPVLVRLHDKITLLATWLVDDTSQQENLVINLINADMRAPLTFLNYIPVLPIPLLQQSGVRTTDQVISLHHIAGAIASVLVVNILALLVSSVFLTILTSGITCERCVIPHCLGRAAKATARMVGFFLVLALLAFLFAFPFLVFTVVIVSYLPESTTPVLLTWLFIWFWVYVYTSFAIEAIIINQVGPVRALILSITFVQHNMFSTLGLLLLSAVMISGMGVIWEVIAHTQVGLPFAMAGSAYIGSGLVAARLVFFQQRMLPMPIDQSARSS